MDDKIGRLEIRGKAVRRKFVEVWSLPRDSVFPFIEPQFLRGAVHRPEIEDAAVSHQCFELRRVALEPVHHVTAVRRPRRRHVISVHVTLVLHVIQPRHQVVENLAAPIVADFVHKLLPEAGAPARIRQRHHVTLRRPELGVPAIRPRVHKRALWPPVDPEDQRVGLRRVEPRRLDDPHLNLRAGLARIRNRFRFGHRDSSEQRVVRVGDRLHATTLRTRAENLRRA